MHNTLSIHLLYQDTNALIFWMSPAFSLCHKSESKSLRVISSVVFFSPQKFYDTAPVHFDSYIAPFQAKG